MDIQFREALLPPEIREIAALADTIWHEAFPAIISAEQIDYMLEKFQSTDVITKAVREDDYHYFFIQSEGNVLGYLGVKKENDALFLSKLYIKKDFQKKGVGQKALEFAEDYAREQACSSIWLTVNQHNGKAITAYERRGFQVIRSQVVDIGAGYVMDDHVMEKRI